MVVLALGLLAGLLLIAIGLGLIFFSDQQVPTNTRKVFAAWNAGIVAQMRTRFVIERLVYRHHRKVGIFLIAATALWLWLISPLNAWRSFLKLTSQYFVNLNTCGHLSALTQSLLALFVLLLGLLLFIRPSLLKPLEALANRRIPFFTATPSFKPLSVFIGRHTQVIGLLVLALGIACTSAAWQLVNL